MDENLTEQDAVESEAQQEPSHSTSSDVGLPPESERVERTEEAGQDRTEGPPPIASLDLNELQTFSGAKLKSLARAFDLHLSSARSNHQQIYDLARLALTRGTTVTTSGFLDLMTDSFAMMRCPALNFLPVPEDVCVPRAVIQQFHLRPG